MPGQRQLETPFNLLREIEARLQKLERIGQIHSPRGHQLVGAQVSKDIPQSIATGIGLLVQVTFNTPVDWDTDTFFDNTNDQFVCMVAGYYFVYAQVAWATGTGNRRARLNKGATYFAESVVAASGSTPDCIQLLVGYKNLAVNDTISLTVAQDSGGALNVDGNGTSQQTVFGMELRATQ